MNTHTLLYYFLQLLKKNVAERLGGGPDDSAPLKSHQFFRHVNWTDCRNHKLEPPFKPNVVCYVIDTCNMALQMYS